MIAATAFILGFIVIALTVALIAFNGGARGAREGMHNQTPRGRMIAAGIIAAVSVGFGIGVPAAVMAGGSGAHKGPGGVHLSSAEVHGRQLFAHNCATCHTLKGANAVGKVGPNLDELRPPKALVLNAIQLGRARGQGQMPANLLQGKDARDVAAFVAAVAGR